MSFITVKVIRDYSRVEPLLREVWEEEELKTPEQQTAVTFTQGN